MSNRIERMRHLQYKPGEYRSVTWTIDVNKIDLEKWYSQKKSRLELKNAPDYRLVKKVRLVWKEANGLKLNSSTPFSASPAFENTQTIEMSQPLCKWEIDGFLRWRGGTVQDTLLLWIVLSVKNPKKKEQFHELGQVYIDLVRFPAGKKVANKLVEGALFDLNINIEAKFSNKPSSVVLARPSQTADDPSLEADIDKLDLPRNEIFNQEEQLQYLQSEVLGKQVQLRMNIVEYEREASNLIKEREEKEKTLADLQLEVDALKTKLEDEDIVRHFNDSHKQAEEELKGREAELEELRAEWQAVDPKRLAEEKDNEACTVM